MSNRKSLAALLFSISVLSGCNDKGADFVGTWHYGSEHTETNIVITKEERSNHYHIDMSQKDISWGDKKFEPYITLEAEATSNDRLEVIGPASAMISDFRLKDNILTMPNGNHYNKVK